MNKLWVFGDSYSEPFFKTNNMPWKIGYLKWKKTTPKCYGEFVSEQLKLKHINLAIGGTDNYTILDTIINVLHSISKEDIIVIGWSHILRYRVVTKKNKFNTIRARSLDEVFKINDKTSYLDLSNQTLTEIAVNRNNDIYIDELNNYIKLLNFTFPNNKIIHWSPFFLERKGLNTSFVNLTQYEKISDETNGEVDDAHFSENGHMKVAERIVHTIDNYQNLEFKKYLL
jgi:hypothetical protein